MATTYDTVCSISIPVWYDWKRNNNWIAWVFHLISIPVWYDWKIVQFVKQAPLNAFQFQYGTIESRLIIHLFCRRNEFQFQYGTIERGMSA